jgi:hypothetical protein
MTHRLFDDFPRTIMNGKNVKTHSNNITTRQIGREKESRLSFLYDSECMMETSTLELRIRTYEILTQDKARL